MRPLDFNFSGDESLTGSQPAMFDAESARRISLLVPVYNTPADVLIETVLSVTKQTFRNWELCLVDDASSDPETMNILDRIHGSQPNIKVIRSIENRHIARATNLAVEFSSGAFIGFLDHDDTLRTDALESVMDAMLSADDVDIVYTDEDKIEPDGQASEPYLKPDWSPEHLCSVAYVLHFMAMRKSLFLEVGGLRHEVSGAQDYDLTLRASARARRIRHIDKVLYHWRKIPGSAAAKVDAKPQALINAKSALADFVASVDPAATVDDGLFTGSFRVKWPVRNDRPVTLLMLTDSRSKTVEGRGDILLVRNAVDSIIRTSTFRNFEIVVVDNGRMDSQTRAWMQASGVRLVDYAFEGAFNYPKKINFGFSLVDTEDVVILNDDIEVISPDWLEALLTHSRRQEVGAVGARLLYPNDRIQHAGVVLGVNGLSTHIFHNQPASDVGYCGYTHLIRNYSAVTGAVMAMRMTQVRELGGFDVGMAIDYNDIDFCLRLGRAGYRIVYTPFATLYHFEGASLARPTVSEPDQAAFQARWSDLIARDPHYNVGLPRDRTDCAVAAW